VDDALQRQRDPLEPGVEPLVEPRRGTSGGHRPDARRDGEQRDRPGRPRRGAARAPGTAREQQRAAPRERAHAGRRQRRDALQRQRRADDHRREGRAEG